VEITPRARALMRTMAGEWADIYTGEILLPSLQRATRAPSASVEAIKDALTSPYRCLEAIFSHYAFARRGKDRQELADLAVEALHRTCREEAFPQLLALPDATILWDTYVVVCEERRKKPMEQLNRGILSGLAELAQEIYRLDGQGCIADWIVKGLVQTDRIEAEFMRIVDIRGVGPKMTSVLLRDVIYLFGLEEKIDHVDRLYVQPIDKWIRLMAAEVIDEVGAADAADWILAGKLAKYTRKAGISGIRFNMGVTAFGVREVRNTDAFEEAVEGLLVKA
jgi:hypothetical protein